MKRIFGLVLLLCSVGCRPAEEKQIPPMSEPATSKVAKTDVTSPSAVRTPQELPQTPETLPENEDEDVDWKRYIEDDEYLSKPLEYGPLLGEDATKMTRLDPKKPVWVYKEKKLVVTQGWVCQVRVPLEFLICQGTGYRRKVPYKEEGMPDTVLQFNGPKSHESIFCIDVPASVLHAGLLAIGAKTGEPVRFQPKLEPPTGDPITITIRWKNPAGEIVERNARELIIDHDTGKPMEKDWVFAGSFFYEDDDGVQRYAADSEGEVVGVSNFPSVMLDVPQVSSSSNESLLYVSNEKELPERGTPVTILFSIAEQGKE
ncbi:MAG: YdjY domain-containing protein [Planctomycetia bacterium]|nr:YdjY domain-containing protein [Planctomycetia bacterium]